MENGYKSAFLENIYSLHIGRLTTEIGEKMNAYDLNDEKQFGEKMDVKTFVVSIKNYDKIECLKFMNPIIYRTDNKNNHINIYTKLLDENKNDILYCILDDDIQLRKDFKDYFTVLVKSYYKISWDILFLGHNTDNDDDDVLKIIRSSNYDFSSYAYLISKKGAEKILKYVESNNEDINTLLHKLADILELYYSNIVIVRKITI